MASNPGSNNKGKGILPCSLLVSYIYNSKLIFFYQFLAEIITISSDSSEAISCDPPSYGFSSDSGESNGWLDYFPKDYKPNPVKLTSKKEEREATVIEKKKVGARAGSSKNMEGSWYQNMGSQRSKRKG